jgi:hypothetical protein
MSENNGGDVLARGGIRATFTTGAKVSQGKWDSIFGGKDEPEDSGLHPDVKESGDAGIDVGEAVPDATGF